MIFTDILDSPTRGACDGKADLQVICTICVIQLNSFQSFLLHYILRETALSLTLFS